MRKTMKNLSQHSRSPGRDSNPGPPECEAGVITTTAKFAWTHIKIYIQNCKNGLVCKPQFLLSCLNAFNTYFKFEILQTYKWPYMTVVHIRCRRLRRHLCCRTLQLCDVVEMAPTASPPMLVTGTLRGAVFQIWRGPMGVLLLVGWPSTTPTFREEAKLCFYVLMQPTRNCGKNLFRSFLPDALI